MCGSCFVWELRCVGFVVCGSCGVWELAENAKIAKIKKYATYFTSLFGCRGGFEGWVVWRGEKDKLLIKSKSCYGT